MSLECDNCGPVQTAIHTTDEGETLTIQKDGTLEGAIDLEGIDPITLSYECPDCGQTVLYIPERKKHISSVKEVSEHAHFLGTHKIKFQEMMEKLRSEGKIDADGNEIHDDIDRQTQAELNKLRQEALDEGYDPDYRKRTQKYLPNTNYETIIVDNNGKPLPNQEDYQDPKAYEQKLRDQKARRDIAK